MVAMVFPLGLPGVKPLELDKIFLEHAGLLAVVRVLLAVLVQSKELLEMVAEAPQAQLEWLTPAVAQVAVMESTVVQES
jgi:hypothetical protein